MRTNVTLEQIKLQKEPLTPSDTLLIKQTIEGVNRRYKDYPENKLSNEDLIARLNYELQTICSMGFADYFLIVSDFLTLGVKLGHMPDDRLDYLRQHISEMSIEEMTAYIEEDQTFPGLTIGIGRGSGAGSVVAYALNITNIEPTQYNLLFDRFLNPERISMPDIDSDFSNSEEMYGIRDLVVEYVSKKYGKDGICGITTKQTMGAKAAIDNVQRVLMNKAITEDPAKEGQFTPYFRKLAKDMKAIIPDEVGAGFATKVSEDKTVYDVMLEQFGSDPNAAAIARLAKDLEGVNINYGKHAAGVIIADNGDVGEYGALMFDTDTQGWKIQMEGPDAEGIGGLLKMDFLGLTTLNVITMAIRLIYENSGHQTYIDPLNLPDEPVIYKEIFAKGNTFGVFQFASPGAKRVLAQIKPTCFEDIILANAINRPGPEVYIPDIAAKKNGRHVDPTVFDNVPCIQEILAPTYGYPVYQEQVMQIPQAMAGYSLGQADEIRRAMSKKKFAVIEENRELFVHGGVMENHDTHKKSQIQGSVARGIPEKDAYAVYDGIQDFAKYGFNKSHAAVYALTAYITAWLKFHYPVEFYTACLTIPGTNTLQDIIADAKANGIKICPPDINKSRTYFTCDKEKIYYGFGGMSLEASFANEAHDFKSMADFVIRGHQAQAAMEKLIKAGALDRFSSSRTALMKVLPIYVEQKKEIAKQTASLNLNTELLQLMEEDKPIDLKKYKLDKLKKMPTKEKIQEKIQKAKDNIAFAENSIRAQVIPMVQFPDDLMTKLQDEKELLGTYVSGHPMDVYGDVQKYNCISIHQIGSESKGESVMGVVTGLKIKHKKDDPSAQMAFFNLEDATGSIPCCMFTRAFGKYGHMLYEGAILKLSGNISLDKHSDDESYQFIIDDKIRDAVTSVKVPLRDVSCTIDGIENFAALKNRLREFAAKEGHAVYVYDQSTGERLKLMFLVSPSAIKQGVVR